MAEPLKIPDFYAQETVSTPSGPVTERVFGVEEGGISFGRDVWDTSGITYYQNSTAAMINTGIESFSAINDAVREIQMMKLEQHLAEYEDISNGFDAMVKSEGIQGARVQAIKSKGYTEQQLAHLFNMDEDRLRKWMEENGYKVVDGIVVSGGAQ